MPKEESEGSEGAAACARRLPWVLFGGPKTDQKKLPSGKQLFALSLFAVQDIRPCLVAVFAAMSAYGGDKQQGRGHSRGTAP